MNHEQQRLRLSILPDSGLAGGAGIATSLGVESTARSVHEHGYNVTIAVDATSDLNPEAHTHTTTRILPLIAETGTTEEVLSVLKSRSPASR